MRRRGLHQVLMPRRASGADLRADHAMHHERMARSPERELLAYDIEQYLIWNPLLINENRARAVYADLAGAVPMHRRRRE